MLHKYWKKKLGCSHPFQGSQGAEVKDNRQGIQTPAGKQDISWGANISFHIVSFTLCPLIVGTSPGRQDPRADYADSVATSHGRDCWSHRGNVIARESAKFLRPSRDP